MIKVEEVADPLAEAPEKVAEALILFCQVKFNQSKLDEHETFSSLNKVTKYVENTFLFYVLYFSILILF